ncbi:MAG: VWA domain-containing protein [Saprospiraceae bacterium]|nr:VWA domain-containing protein [Saprospiraceae bacterium]
MFRFEHPDYLYFLALIPIAILVIWLGNRIRKNQMSQFGNPELLESLVNGFSRKRKHSKNILFLSGLFLLIIGWANPQWGAKKEKVKSEGIDLMIALDISQSMLAEDIAPSRLERAKRFTENLIDAFKGNRIGFIVFAGNAYLQVPLTNDYAAATLFVRAANPNLAGTQGTALGSAMELAQNAFPPESQQQKVLIIISDGENHDDALQEQLESAKQNGILIFTIGVGTPEGDMIPMYVNGRRDFKRDESGNPVKSALDQEMLKNIADQTGGFYANIVAGEDKLIGPLQSRIAKIEKRSFEQRSFTEFESYYQYFIFIGLFLLLADFWMPQNIERKDV